MIKAQAILPLFLLMVGPSRAADLKPGETLEGQTFTVQETLRLKWEAQAHALEKKYPECKVAKEGAEWVVSLRRSVELMKYTYGRSLDRNEKIEGGILFKPWGEGFATEEEAKKYAREHPEVYRVKPYTIDGGNGVVRYRADWFDKIDLIEKARQMLRVELEKTRWLPLEGIDGFARGEVQEGGQGDGAQLWEAAYQHPGGGGVTAGVKTYPDRPMTDHDLLREMHLNPMTERADVIRVNGNTVVKFRATLGTYVSWRFDENRAMEIQSRDDPFPEAVLKRYLDLYPSVWPEGFRADRLAWFQREGDLLLDAMEKQVDAPMLSNGEDPYVDAYLWFYKRFDAPIPYNWQQKLTPQERRDHLGKTRVWWAEKGRAAGPRPDPYFMEEQAKRRDEIMRELLEQEKRKRK